MRTKNLLTLIIMLIVFMISCELEKTEFKKTDRGYFYGNFIIHKNSISYYDDEKNKIFNDLYYYQNGTSLRKGIHSLVSGFYTSDDLSLISFQEDNAIEWIDGNFISQGILQIEKPRHIFKSGARYALVSYGNHTSGGIAVIDIWGKDVVDKISTSIVAGKFFQDTYNLFIMSDGSRYEDSLIYRFYDYQKIDSFSIGIRPIDCMKTWIPGINHPALAILCLGNETTPASVVMFDLISMKIAFNYSFESTFIKPENLFRLYLPGKEETATYKEEMVSYINNKIYKLTLGSPIKTTILIDKNIKEVRKFWPYIVGISSDTTSITSTLYRFNENLELFDSLTIAGKAIKFAERY